VTSGRRTPLDYLFFMRPVLLPPVWTIALLGTIGGENSSHSPLLWALFLLQLSCLFGAVYTLNQTCDIESDRLNRKLHFLPDGIISLRAAWVFTAVLNVFALAAAFAFGVPYVVLTILLIALGVVYSVGHRPWKNQPLMGLAANCLGHGAIVFLLGAAFAGRPVLDGILGSLGYTAAVFGVYLATTVPDYEGDRRTGKQTAAVVWGQKLTMIVATVCVGAAAVLGAWRGDRYLAFAAVATWPFFLRATLAPGTASTAAKAGVAALSIAAAIAYPMYLVLLVLGFLGTRLFFHWRFGITYPTLK